MAKYEFGWSASDEFAVEIPELDAFISDIKAVCERHGVGFDLDRCWSDSDSTEMVLVPFEEASFDFITEDLEDYRGGIPWLDEAKTEWERRREKHYAAKEAADRARAEAARKAKEDEILQNGVIVAGKKYKLVES